MRVASFKTAHKINDEIEFLVSFKKIIIGLKVNFFRK